MRRKKWLQVPKTIPQSRISSKTAKKIVDEQNFLGYKFKVFKKDGGELFYYLITFEHTKERKVTCDELDKYTDSLAGSVVQNEPFDRNRLYVAAAEVLRTKST